MAEPMQKLQEAPLPGRGVALFLDFDGTLAEIAEKPDAVAVDPSLPPVLARLREQLGGALAIVSGRPIAFLDDRLGSSRFDAAGLHGVEYRIGGQLSSCRPEDHPNLRAAVARLEDVLEPHPGLLVEDKGCSVAIHWRLAPHEADFARSLACAMAEALGPEYRLQHGKAVAEILPAGAAKGAVIERFLDEPAYRGRIPVFIGDDLTDEGGFAVVNARGGVSVRVGEGPTGAPKRVASPGALRALLSRWAEAGRIDLQELPSA
jgi:trehalose 6-phosphate phosphatase